MKSFHIGLEEARKGNFSIARLHFLKAYAEDQDNLDTINNIAYCRFAEKQYDQAIILFEASLRRKLDQQKVKYYYKLSCDKVNRDADLSCVQQNSYNSDQSSSPVHTSQDELDGYKFEDLIAELLRRMKLEVQQTMKSADGGVDIVVKDTAAITGGTYVVQCKHHKASIGEPVLRDLYGTTIHLGASKGILITNSTFTKKAVQFAENKPLELVDGNALNELICLHLNDSSDSLIDVALFKADVATIKIYEGIAPLLESVKRELEMDRLIKPTSVRISEWSLDVPQNEFTRIGIITANWVGILEHLGILISHQIEDPDAIETCIHMIHDCVSECQKSRKRFRGIKPADRDYIFVHTTLLEAYDLLLKKMIELKEFIAIPYCLNNKWVIKDLKIDLIFDLDTAFLKTCSSSLNEFYNSRRLESREVMESLGFIDDPIDFNEFLGAQN